MQFPVTPVLASSGTLYFSDSTDLTVDGDWNILSNWWEDAGFTIQSTTIPDSSNTVEIFESITTNTGSPASVISAIVHNSTTLGIILDATGNIDFMDGSSSTVIVTSTSGSINFYTTSTNTGTVTAPTISFHDTANNTGTLNGDTHFYDTATMVSGTVTGDATFDGSNNAGNIIGNAFFNNAALNAGTITGNVTFTGSAYGDQIQVGTIGWSLTFSNNVTFTLAPSMNWTVDTSSWTFQGSRNWIFSDSNSHNTGVISGSSSFTNGSNNTGTINGSASFASGSNNNSTVNWDASFYDSTVNTGSVTWSASFYDTSTTTGSVGTLVNRRNTATSSVNTSGSFTHLIAYDNSINDQTVSGNAIFFNASTNTNTVSGNADFYNTSNTSGTINGVMWIHDGRALSVFGGVFDGVALYDTCTNNIPTIGNKSFYGSSSNTSAVTGNAYFYNSSFNNTSVSGQAFFYNSSYNAGTVTLAATFTDSSHNDTTVTGNASFSGTSYNAGTVGGTGGFTGQSYNIGTISSNATFVDTSYNSLTPLGTIVGNADFGCFAANLGTVVGTASYITACVSGPTGDLSSLDDTGASASDNLTKLTTVRMTGTCDTSLVTVFVDGISIGDATNYDNSDCSSPGATYSISTSPAITTLSEGVHTITTVRSNALGILYGASPVSSSVPFTVDITPPILTINQAGGQADPTNVALMNFTVVFSEAIDPATFTSADITFTGTGTATAGTPTTLDTITWNIPVTATSDGTIIASMTATKVTDIAGNDNTASTSTDNSVTYDTVAPSVTLTRAIGQSATSSSYSVYFTAVFSEAINPASFTAADITLSGTGPGVVGTPSNPSSDGITWTLPVTASGLGTFILNITTNKYSDPAGNSNTTTTLSPTVEIVAGGWSSSTPIPTSVGGGFSVGLTTVPPKKTVIPKTPLKTLPTTTKTIATPVLNSAGEKNEVNNPNNQSNSNNSNNLDNLDNPNNPINKSLYAPITWGPDTYTQLQSKWGKKITEEKYLNQCVTKWGGSYYRSCSDGSGFKTLSEFVTNWLCEWFFDKPVSGEVFNTTDIVSRKETLDIAVKMRTKKIESTEELEDADFLDIREFWLQDVASVWLHFGIISPAPRFSPDRDISRYEAYAMLTKSVCMDPLWSSDWDTWTDQIYTTAKTYGLTAAPSRDKFRWGDPITRGELTIIASRAADWAENTGGCDPKPKYCFSK